MLTGAARPEKRGSLTVVGTGIRLGLQLTAEAQHAIERADRVLLVVEPATQFWIRQLNDRAEGLSRVYQPGQPRSRAYDAMVDAMLAPVRAGETVCAAFYGHPGVFVRPGHEAVRRAREEGYEARMLAGVSAADCLVAHLGIDPAIGWQSFEATDFLVHGRTPDPTAGLLLWQVAFVGSRIFMPEPDRANVPVLTEYLARFYPADHEVVLYEASPYPVVDDAVKRLPLGEITPADVAPMATMYVPPARDPQPDPQMLARLGLAQPDSGGSEPASR